MNIPTVIIKRCPIDSFSYFQWFLLGLYILEDQKQIRLKFKINLFDKIVLFWFNNKYISGSIRRLIHKFFRVPRYNLFGEVKTDKYSKSFSIDSKDSPFIFTVKDLKRCNAYFKLQCPKEINPEGFEIVPGLFLPWQDVKFKNKRQNTKFSRVEDQNIYLLKDKIFPGMVGPRRLGWTCKKKILYNNYLKYLNTIKKTKRKILIAYFGNGDFPTPSPKKSNFDLDWENDLMSYLGPEYNHPNEKREYLVKMLRSSDSKKFEGRLIREKNGTLNSHLIIPIEKFCDFLSNYCYNFNISGFRMSIPNRFIESFMAGTAIITDKLKVKWYLPFEKEVYEIEEMGYLNNKVIDWDKIRQEIQSLPYVKWEEIRNSYMKKWEPSKFARYIIDTTIGR